MKAIIALLLSAATVACMGSGGRRPSVTPNRPDNPGGGVESQLRGRWTLASLETQGQPRRASGHASFDDANNVSIRADIDPSEPGITAPRTILMDFTARAVVQSANQLSYVGLQQRAPADQLVPTASDPSAWRHFSVNGDTLQIWLEDGGGRRMGAMTFTRAQ